MLRIRMVQKLWLAVFAIVAALVAVLGMAGYRSASVQTVSNAKAAEMGVRVDAAVRWMGLTETNAVRTKALVVSSDPVVEDEFKSAIAETTARITEVQKSLEAMALNQADRLQMEKIAAARKTMIDLRGKARELKAQGLHEEAVSLVRQSYDPAVVAYLKTLQEFVQMQQQAAQVSAQEMAVERLLTVKLAAMAVAALLLAIVMGAYFLIGSIQAPLAQAQALAARIAQGDLSARQQVRRTDEFGDLLRSLYAMCEALSAMVQQVRSSTDRIALASTEIASGNQDLSTRTEQTSSNLQQTAAAMEEFTSTLQQSADSARQASSLAEGASAVARHGGEVVAQVVETMQGINESSRKISDIIGVIDSIAFQTNILALNAAVEAARAGELGKGFAVVAAEVRSLAQRSAEAAKESKQLISASEVRVEGGARLVQQAGQTMSEIVESVSRVTAMIGEITAVSGEQSTGVSQVNQAVSELDRMTQQNAALVEQSAAAAQSLRDQAQQLMASVAVFKTA
ncbi:methyl-accepting chemotaxis protein, partial [Comamonas composti]|uniref:methyl-accepting chemotaxis protein n=1 Tax=Comamonas composti TaxID=408558 RepID=UPI000558C315